MTILSKLNCIYIITVRFFLNYDDIYFVNLHQMSNITREDINCIECSATNVNKY